MNKTLKNIFLKGQKKKKVRYFSIYACHPCAGAMLIFSVSFQFLRMAGEPAPTRSICCSLFKLEKGRDVESPFGKL